MRDPRPDRIAQKLMYLEKKIAELFRIVQKNKQKARIGKRANRGADVVEVAAAPSSTMDMFLEYLDRLQDKVIECIHNITLTNRSAEFRETSATLDAEGVQKRQLLVPNITAADLAEFGLDKNGDYSKAKLIQDALHFLLLANNKGLLQYADQTPHPALDWGSVYAHLASDGNGEKDPAPVGKLGIEMVTPGVVLPLNTTTTAVPTTPTVKPSPPSSPSPSPSLPPSNIAAAFPYFLGPGPFVPPGININWPGPNNQGPGNLETFPMIEDDLGPGAAEEVRKWFEEEGRRHHKEMGVAKEDTGQGGKDMSGW